MSSRVDRKMTLFYVSYFDKITPTEVSRLKKGLIEIGGLPHAVRVNALCLEVGRLRSSGTTVYSVVRSSKGLLKGYRLSPGHVEPSQHFIGGMRDVRVKFNTFGRCG